MYLTSTVYKDWASYLRHVAFNLRLAIAIGFLKGLLITALFNTKPAKVDVMSNFDLFKGHTINHGPFINLARFLVKMAENNFLA